MRPTRFKAGEDIPFRKGYYGVDYRTLLGLQRAAPGANSEFKVGDPAWDIYIGSIPFLLAMSEERPYIRETAPLQKDRRDNARDPGEQSLSPNTWLRSWTSWHLGAGQANAEPLETDPDIARFRFSRSAGLNPWTTGQMSLLKQTTDVRDPATRCVGVDGVGVVTATPLGVWVITVATNRQVSSSVVNSITGAAKNWAGIEPAGTVVFGDYTAGSTAGTAVTGITGATALNYAKDRWWVGEGRTLWEIPDLAGAPVKAHEFNEQSTIIDIDTGPGGIYVMVDDGQTRIYVITSSTDGTLDAPREMAVLPRGESGNFLYGYLGRYLIVGTSDGVRVADAGSADSLPLGPLVIEMVGGCRDATASGNFVWVTAGDESIDSDGEGTMLAGLYRMDLSRIVQQGQAYGDSAASRYAYATDVYSDMGVSALSVTHYEGRVWFVVGDVGDPEGVLVRETSEVVPMGWFETGRVTYSTAEQKAWQSVLAESSGNGAMGFFGDSGSGFSPVVQSTIPTPFNGDAEVDTFVHPASGYLNMRVEIYSTDDPEGPVLESLGLRAYPNPRRSRFVRIPLMSFDQEVDRNGSPVGYTGFSSDRLFDLENLEASGGLVNISDTRTGENVKCQIEKVTFEASTPPAKGIVNYGGFVTVTALIV